MSAVKQDFLSSEDRQFLKSFIGILQKCGNKERALSMYFSLLKKLKEGIYGSSTFKRYPLDTLNEKNPMKLIHKSLYNLKPAFLIRRVIKSGKRYDLPVPISDKRATFMAMNWLCKAILKNNKNDLSFSSLLALEISAILHHQGSAKDFLKAYIDIALDQRPFGRFIKRRKYVVSKSKRTRIAARFKKIQENIRQIVRARKYRSIGIIRKLNKHNIRSVASIKKKIKYSKKYIKNKKK